MGAYFTLRAEKKSLPLFADADQAIDAKITLRSGKLMARAFANSFKGEHREAVARSFLTAIVRTYWDKLQESAPKRFSLLPLFRQQSIAELPDTVFKLARTMGEAASLLEPLAASYLISVTYTAMLPDDTRSLLGAYYTPPPLAERLSAMATSAGVNWSTCRVLDPACGGGAFLSAVATPLVRGCGDVPATHILASIADRLRGFELDPFAAWLSQAFLEACLMPLCQKAGERLPVLVQVRDSLTAPEPEAREEYYDLVIGNPPYGRISLPPRLRDRFRRSLYGHANLYGLFTDLAVRLVRPGGGLIAYVTPTSFLAGEYFKALRSLLVQSARPVNIDFVSVRKGIFDDALQETMLATYRKTGVYLHFPTVHFIAPRKDDSISVEKGGDFELPKGGGPWLVPRSHEQAQLIASLRSMRYRLKDYGYEVSTGPLVWNRHKSQIVRSNSARNVFPLIWAEAVTPDGRFQFRADKKNHLPYFKTKAGDEWLLTRTACVLLQRTTAKEQPRRLIAASMPPAFIREYGAVVIENHLNMILPVGTPLIPAGLLAAVLNTPIVDRAFRCLSGSVAVSAYELENLPLPPPADLKLLIGRAIQRDGVAEACLQLYLEARNA